MLKDIDTERQIRFNSRLNNGNGEMNTFINWLKNFPDNNVRDIGLNTLNTALKLNYNHNILNTSTYLAHVLRVTKMSIELSPSIAIKSVSPALVHNVLESTSLKEKDLLKHFNAFTTKTIKTLSVNRKKQNSQSYLKNYYSNIAKSHSAVGIIKIADKLDNIFTICLNPDNNKRTQYLKQIEDFIVPLVKLKAPHLLSYLIELINNTYKIGHVSLEKKNV